jgi:hypothetical protein
MDENVRKAYDKLVPVDQLVIDAMIVALSTKDIQIRGLVKAFQEQLHDVHPGHSSRE